MSAFIERLVELLDGTSEWDELRKICVEQAEANGDVVSSEFHHNEIADQHEAIKKVEAELDTLKSDMGDLYDPIVEGRRDDAIRSLTDISGTYFRPVAAQRNLFPERVPA